MNEPRRRCARLRESLALSAPSPTTRLTVLRRLSETLATAAIGGAALGLIGVPAGWLSGSILAVAGSAIAGRPMLIPTLLMRAIFVLIGTSLGAVVTPETLHGMATYPLSIAVLIVAMAVISVGGAGYLRLVHGWGRSTPTLRPRRAACRKSWRSAPSSVPTFGRSRSCKASALS